MSGLSLVTSSVRKINIGAIASGIEKELKSAKLRVAVKSAGDSTEIEAYSLQGNMVETLVRRLIDIPDLIYTVSRDGVRGPNPARFNNGKSLMHAAVHNVADDLFVDDLVYDPLSGMYQKKQV